MTAQSPVDTRTSVGPYGGGHRCAAGRSCRDPVINGDTREPAIIAEARGLCRRCHSMVNRAAAELGTDYAALGAAIGDRSPVFGDRVRATPTPPIPVNIATDALARSLAEWADAALGVVCAALAIDHPVPYRGRGFPMRNGAMVAAAGRIVAPNVDLLLAAPSEPVLVWSRDGVHRRLIDADGIDIGLALARNHRHVIAVLGDPNPRERLAMPCPVFDCGAPTLGRSNGSTDVTCTTCGGRWTEREYAWLAGLLVADIRKEETVTTDKLSEAVLARQLAESELEQANSRLDKLRRVGEFTPDDIGTCSAMDIVTLIAELTE